MRGLYNLLVRSAASYPDQLAAVCGDGRFSYAQFKDRVDRLAQEFESIGVDKGDKIAVIYESCHRFLETYFAAARKDAILVPVNARLATEDFLIV